jgi:hypothetical protein
MVKNQAKIPHFWLWYFDKKAAPNLIGTACARLGYIIFSGCIASLG